jgi:hypothetical protein
MTDWEYPFLKGLQKSRSLKKVGLVWFGKEKEKKQGKFLFVTKVASGRQQRW